jgi:hypothetical protein
MLVGQSSSRSYAELGKQDARDPRERGPRRCLIPELPPAARPYPQGR